MKKIVFLTVACSFLACATITPLTGGEKDTSPPKILHSDPDSAQLNFFKKDIILELDEFFTVQNIQQELIISPPFDKPVTHRIKGKSLIISFPDYPLSNTTYQLNFGQSIKDVNESNPIKNYTLVFATGNQIDSGYVKGSVIDAKTLKPVSKCKILLYINQNDSNVFNKLPYYLTLSDSFGNFKINHIANGKYQVLALLDDNQNNHLEFGEKIGFLDSLVNSNSSDITIKVSDFNDNRKIRILSSSEINEGVFQLSFNRPILNTLPVISCNSLIHPANKNNTLPTKFIDEKRDRILTYISIEDSIKSESDSILFLINTNDTLLSTWVHRKKSKPLLNEITLKSSTFHADSNIYLTALCPIYKTASDNIEIFNITDSTTQQIISVNLTTPFELSITTKMLSGKEYRLITKPKALTMINQQHHKTDTFYFRTYKDNELGHLELTVRVDTSTVVNNTSLILELFKNSQLTTEPTIVYTKTVSKDTLLRISSLIPGEYYVRAYLDEDLNKKWTDGDYSKKQHSEPLYLRKEPIVVRANWESKNIIFKIK